MAFVTFSNIPKLGLNPKNAFDTPTGIYGYPLFGGVDSGKISNFATERPYAIVFRPVNPDKILDLARYTQEDYNKDVVKLKNYFTGLPNDDIYHNAKSNAYQQDKPSSWMWNTLKALSDTVKMDREQKTSSQFQWNQIMHNVLGYEGVYDSAGEGIIHHNEPFQAVFFRTNVVELVEMINKTELETISTKGKGKVASNEFQKLNKAMSYATGKSKIPVPELSDADLNFEFFKEKVFELKDIRLNSVKFEQGRIKEGSSFDNVVFEDCAFYNINIEGIYFNDCRFTNCFMRNADFNRKSLFVSCKFVNSIFNDCLLFSSYEGELSFNGCDFGDYTTLKPQPFKGSKKAEYVDCQFEGLMRIYLDTLKNYMSLNPKSKDNLKSSLNSNKVNVGLDNSFKSQSEIRQDALEYLSKFNQ